MPRLQRVREAFDEEVAEGWRESLEDLIKGLSTFVRGGIHKVYLAKPLAPFAGIVSRVSTNPVRLCRSLVVEKFAKGHGIVNPLENAADRGGGMILYVTRLRLRAAFFCGPPPRNRLFTVLKTCCITASCRISSSPFTSCLNLPPLLPMHFTILGRWIPVSVMLKFGSKVSIRSDPIGSSFPCP